MEEEKREHDTKLKKMEQEMEQVFEMKVKEKKQKLKDSEIDVSFCYKNPPSYMIIEGRGSNFKTHINFMHSSNV